MTSAHRDRRWTRVRWCGQAALSVAAVIGTVSILVTLAAVVLDLRTLVFRSGSMEPAISTGALAFAKSTAAADLEVGDIVSVTASNGSRITHRVQSLDVEGATARLVLKGDANSSVDAETYVVTSADRVIVDVPYIGYAIGHASGPAGMFVGGLVVAGLLWLIVRPSGPSDRGPRQGRRRATAAGAVAAMAVASGAAPPTSTMAYFNDSGSVESSSFATHTMVPPNTPTCADKGGLLGLLGYVTATWTNVEPRYEYRVVVINVATGLPVGNAVVVPNPGASSSVVSYDFTMGLLNLGLGTRDYDLRVYSTLTSNPVWTSVTYATVPVRTQSLLVGLSLRCR